MKGNLKAAVGILLSLLLLWWALRDVSFAEVARHVRDADYVLFGLAIVVALTGFPIRALRWGVLLLPVAGKVPFRALHGATFIGFALNNILPARIGEFARAYSLGRVSQVRTGAAFATLVIERLLDGVIVVGLLFAAMAAPGFPVGEEAGLRSGALVVALGMAGVGFTLFLAVTAPEWAAKVARTIIRPLPRRLHEPAVDALRSFAAGLAILRSGRLFAISALLAAAQWVWLALSFFLAFRAFGIDDVPFTGAVFLQSLMSLAVAIPSSPGFFGPFEAGARIGLSLWDVPADQAISFAIGFHIGGYIPVTVIGLYFLWAFGLSWKSMRSAEERRDEIEPDEAPLVTGKSAP